MYKVFVSALFSVLLYMTGCSTGESVGSKSNFSLNGVDKVAVIEVSGDLDSEAAKNQIADFVAMEFLKKGFVPIERTQVSKILQEQQFQESGLTSQEGNAMAGKLLNVQGCIIVNIPKFGESINMTIKMVDVNDGSLIWMGSGSGTTGKTMATFLGAAIGAGTGAAVSGDSSSSKVIGGVAGGVIGGVAGRALTPQEETQVQQIIKKICLTLPDKNVK